MTESELTMRILFIMIFIYSQVAENAVAKQIETQRKYERKSISFIDMLIVTNPNLKVRQDEVSYILRNIRKYIELERFDYNPIPENMMKELRTKLTSRGVITLDELRGLIDETLVPELKKILDIEGEMRAQELVSETERAGFIATKAKELGITAEDIEKVLNAGYLYVPALTNYKMLKNKKKNTITCTIGTAIIWYHLIYVGDKAHIELLKITETTSLGTAALDAKGLKWPPIKGKKVKPQKYAYCSAVDNAARNLQREMKSLSPFKLSAPLMEAFSNSVKFNLGTKEGLRLDWKFDILETIETEKGLKEHKVGFVKVRSIANNKKNGNALSGAQPIIGSFDKGMLAVEHSRLGLDILIRGCYFPVSTDHSGSLLSSTGNGSFGIDVAVQYNIGQGISKFIPLSILSEIWTTMDFQFGIAPGIKGKVWNDEELEWEEKTSTTWGVEFGLLKKLYFHRLALIGESRFGFTGLSLVDENASSPGFTFLGGIEIAVFTDLNIGLQGGYRLYGEDKLNGSADIDFAGPIFGLYVVYSPPSLPFDPWSYIMGFVSIR